VNKAARFAIVLLGAYVGWLAMQRYASLTPQSDDYLAIIGLVVGGVVGFAIAGPVARGFYRVGSVVESGLAGLSAYEFSASAIGLLVGLIVTYTMRGAYEDLGLLKRFGPEPFYILWGPIVVLFAYAGYRVGRRQRIENGSARRPPRLLDTSVIIDGRVVDIARSGFLEGPIVVPRFVLSELQLLADSTDPTRRARGKRGLDVLGSLRAAVDDFEVKEYLVDDRDVDGKLVTLARSLSAKIVTNDFNLNRVAKLQGVDVLNINELANAVKAVALPGEEMSVSIIRDGKEPHQGVGFLDDGTMVVVENGRERKGEHIGVEVTSVLQTAAGRMVFAKPKR
jgi:uncharacterized protein YacL